MDGFEKIDLSNTSEQKQTEKTAPTQEDPMPPMAKRKTKLTKKYYITLGVVVVLILFSLFGVIIPTIKVIADAKKTASVGKLALSALKTENIAVGSDNLRDTKNDLAQVQKDLQGMGYLRFIPPLNFYYNDAVHLANAGSYGLTAAQIAVDAIKPYADVLGLKGAGSFTGGTAQQRIQTAVTTMSKVTPQIDLLEAQLILAQKEIDAVSPGHYPSFLGLGAIKTTLASVKTTVDDAANFTHQAKPLIKVLPALLGDPSDKKYLILFQNDKELRPTGGFITAYAIFRLTRGVIAVDSSNDIYNLDATIGNKPPAPKPIALYLPQVPLWNLRDTNLSPDFVKSMDDFNKLYKTAGGYVPVDGIIAIDTHALVAAMSVLGDIQADGQTFTTKTDPRCNCPQVIYALEQQADQPVGFVKTNRKSVVGDLLYAIMQRAFASSPKKYWGPLVQTMIAEINQKHILFDINSTDAQSGLEALNAAGRIQNFDGDYLHVNDSNFGGAKANLFITEAVAQTYSVSSDGTIQKTVKITYKNPYQPSDCNLEHGNLCLNAIQRDWLRLYVPKGSQLVTSQGSEVKVTSYEDLGKTVFDGFLTVRPLGSSTFTITYTLPFKLAGGSPLPLLIQKQPGTDNQDYSIFTGSRKLADFPLLTDMTFKLNVR